MKKDITLKILNYFTIKIVATIIKITAKKLTLKPAGDLSSS